MPSESKLDKAGSRAARTGRGRPHYLRAVPGSRDRAERPDDEAPDRLRLGWKKKQKVDMLLDLLGPLDYERCLLITCGNDSGTLGHHLRAAGGSWKFVELEAAGIPHMQELLGEDVLPGRPEAIPLPGRSFERVVVADVHVCLEAVEPLNREIARLLAPEGVAIIATPNADPALPLIRARERLGLGVELYGHRVIGYTMTQLEAMASAAGLRPLGRASCVRFFTELSDLATALGYARLHPRAREGSGPGSSPGAHERPRDVAFLDGLDRKVYPLTRSLSALDAVLPGRGRTGYSVAIAALKVD